MKRFITIVILFITINCSGQDSTCIKKVDSLKTQLVLTKYQLKKIKFYVDLCMKNPSQRKFLTGWIRRVIYQ